MQTHISISTLNSALWLDSIAKSTYLGYIFLNHVPTQSSSNNRIFTPNGVKDGQEAYKAFDKDLFSFTDLALCSDGTTYIGYDFTVQRKVKIVTIRPYYLVNTRNYIKEYTIQGSNDKFVSDIHDLVNNTLEETTNYGMITHVLNNEQSYRYYRCLVVQRYANVRIHELDFFSR